MELATDVVRSAERGDVQHVLTSLDNGTHVNARSVFQTCLLHIAAQRGYEELLAQLIERGADLNALDYV